MRSQEKATVVCLGWGTEGGQGSRAPLWYLLGALRAARAKQETGVDKRIFHANSILFPWGRKAPIEPNL